MDSTSIEAEGPLIEVRVVQALPGPDQKEGRIESEPKSRFPRISPRKSLESALSALLLVSEVSSWCAGRVGMACDVWELLAALAAPSA